MTPADVGCLDVAAEACDKTILFIGRVLNFTRDDPANIANCFSDVPGLSSLQELEEAVIVCLDKLAPSKVSKVCLSKSKVKRSCLYLMEIHMFLRKCSFLALVKT